MRWSALILVMSACQPFPERPDPMGFPSASDDTDAPPIANNCDTLDAPFESSWAGSVSGTMSGFGSFEVRAADELTSIFLRGCGVDGEDRSISINLYGPERAPEGTFPFVREASFEEASFMFSDAGPDDPTNCSDQPEGELVIESSTFSRITGTFSLEVGCRNAEIFPDLPKPAVFTGSFEARNYGRE